MRILSLLVLLLIPGLAGCVEDPDVGGTPFVLHVANRTDLTLYETYEHNGKGAGGGVLPPQDKSHTQFPCLTTSSYHPEIGETWRFKLALHHGSLGDGALFAEQEATVSCDHYTFWVHQNATLYFEEGRTTDGPAPWER